MRPAAEDTQEMEWTTLITVLLNPAVIEYSLCDKARMRMHELKNSAYANWVQE